MIKINKDKYLNTMHVQSVCANTWSVDEFTFVLKELV